MCFSEILTLLQGYYYLLHWQSSHYNVKQHKDLGVLVTNNLTWSNHINCIYSSAYRSLHLIHRSVSSNNPSLRKCLYITLVHSRLIYCSQIWRPRLIKYIVCLEKVQRRATKYILNDYSTDYKTRLMSLHLLPLMYWLELQDLMFLIKCIKDPDDNCDISNHVKFMSSPTRASSLKHLQHNISRFSTTRHFYFNRIVPLWNSLVSEIVLSLSVLSIKSTSLNSSGVISWLILIQTIRVLFTIFVPVLPALKSHIHNNLLY